MKTFAAATTTTSQGPTTTKAAALTRFLRFFLLAVALPAFAALQAEHAFGQVCVAPVSGCRSSGQSVLLIKNNPGDDPKDSLTWKWLKGTATTIADFGVPTQTTAYTLCIYAGTSTAAIAEADVAPSTILWGPKGTRGFKYKDRNGSSDGIRIVILKTGAAGKAKAVVTGKGANLPDPPAGPLPLPVTAQLVNSANNVCFEGIYDSIAVKKNDAEKFKASEKTTCNAATNPTAPGCGLHTGLSLTHQGIVRTYDVLVPASYDGSTAVPLVIDMHGYSWTSAFQRSVSGFAAIGEAEGFVVAWPQGLGPPGETVFNAGAFCGDPSVDDVGFIRKMVAAIRASNRIDEHRIYATGLSCGGAMTHRLACEAADLIAAAAPFASPGPLVPCGPSRATPILMTHSRLDTWVPYEGGQLGGCPTCGTVAGVVSQFEAWRDRDGCTGSSPDVTETPGTSSVCELYSNCIDGAQVGLCSVDSKWPGPGCTVDPSLCEGHVPYAPYVLDGFNTQQRAWDFLSSFTLPDIPGDPGP